MRIRWALGFILLLISFATVLALPMKPDVGRMLENEIKKQQHYPPARVAWNGPEVRRRPYNPTYESMMYTLSAEAMREKLLMIAVPSPSLLLSIAALIYLLRLWRRERASSKLSSATALQPANLAADQAA